MDVKVDENLMKDGNPDIEQIKPFLYDPSFRTYRGIGKLLGNAFSIGRDLIK